MNLFSGVSPLLPEAILIVGAYLWFWCNLRGLAHFGDGQPVLPKEADLPMFPPRSPRDKLQSAMKVFSQEGTGISVESEARPLSRAYLKRLAAFLGASTLVCRVSLGGVWVPTLGEWEFGALIFGWVCLYVALVLADTYQVWKAWNELRQLLIRLDRLALRRTLRGLKGIAWGSIWGIGENVLEARYRMISLERESLSHLKNAMPADVWNALPADAHETLMTKVDAAFVEYARWYVTLTRGALVGDLKRLHELQGQFAQAAGMVLQHILVPAWQKESDSLIYEDPGGPAGQESPKAPDLAAGTPHQVPPHVRAAEEFFVLPYLAFVQNILGRIRTAILGVVWLFVAVALAVSSYPFEPSNTLAAIFLAVFLIVAGVMTVVYAQMSRDATLSHVTDTKPGELGWAFWTRMLAFGAGPLVALVATWFPAVADFAFSWLQPSVQALR
jgi:hypothetical protein